MNKEVDYLVISYYFPPRIETSGLVVARRIMEKNLYVDVIQSAYDSNSDFNDIISDYVNERYEVDISGKPDYIPFIFDYIAKGLDLIEKDYKNIYSRSYIYSNHFLALEYKFKNPDVTWTAEFSDPLLLNLYTGKPKNYPRAILDKPEYVDKLNSKINEFNAVNGTDFEGISNPTNTFFLAEYLTFLFADKIIFTNEFQRDVMLSSYPEEIKELVIEKSVLQAHPTIDSKYYNYRDCGLELDKDYINMAYFGTYYYIRHFESLFYAFEALNHKYKNKIRLYFFTSRYELLDIITSDLEISDNIIIEKPLDYFEFLNATTKFDILLLNDTVTKGHFDVNPFLPSKYSDYIGSGSDIWCICEQGSILSEKDFKYKSWMDDYQSSCDELIKILNDYGYEDSDFSFNDKVYEKRINDLNWKLGFEFDEKNRNLTRYNKLKIQNEQLRNEKNILMEKKENLKAKNDILREKNEKLNAKNIHVIEKNKEFKQKNKELKEQYNKILSSSSWKVTAPLRKIRNIKK